MDQLNDKILDAQIDGMNLAQVRKQIENMDSFTYLQKVTPKLECMISGLLAVTSMEMESFLPHKELQIDEKLNVAVNWQNCSDLASRDKNLKAQNENNIAVSFNVVAGVNREKIFITKDGEKISFDVPIVANSRKDTLAKRTFLEKFILKSREYKYGDKYYRVQADANNEKNTLWQYEFMIDIAFVDDFRF